MIKIAVFNQKGGVAKTTTTVNIAASLVKYSNKKVLTVNCDSQITLHQFLLTYTDPSEIKQGSVRDLFSGADVDDIASPVYISEGKNISKSKLYVISSEKDIHLWNIENGKQAEESLNNSSFDYCIFDLPPHLSGISLAALSICDYIIVPAIPDMDSLIGFDDIVNTVKLIRNNGGNPNLNLLGVVFCKVEPYMTHSYIMASIRDKMGNLCFETVIKNKSIVEQSRFYGSPICYFSPKSETASEYHDLIIEIEKKIAKDKKRKGLE